MMNEITLDITKGSFQWAINQMKDLKCVRRKNWQPSHCICVLTGTKVFYDEDGKLPHLNLLDIESNDWEIYEEFKKTKTHLKEVQHD